MDCLQYPLDSAYLLRKRKAIRRELLQQQGLLPKNVAILGGSTTTDIANMLELFLLGQGIKPAFYQSEYGQYWQDAMFDNPELAEFRPDVIFIHTSLRNLLRMPTLRDSAEGISAMRDEQLAHFTQMWDRLAETYNCPIIQNNFERPYYRLLGNADISDIHGLSNYAARLNAAFYDYAASHETFYIHDIEFLAAAYGADWHDSFYWHMYKYALSVNAIPEFALNLANIIKSIFGRNKKAFVMDLDNTLWGGVVGDDGVEGIALGPEVSMGQAYDEFQRYIKAHKDMGIILNVASKNEHENAIAGLNHPSGTLSPEDFISIKANWDNKDRNILEMAAELSLGADSFVFVDDNPAERGLVAGQVQGIAVPDVGNRVEHYIRAIDRNGYFELTQLSADDMKRNEMYRENAQRTQMQSSFENYEDYLLSLDMRADILPFEDIHLQRITQLTNKSNQFNLTTRRYTESEIAAAKADPARIAMYGRLEDKFGDNGIVSIVIAEAGQAGAAHIELWLMSCRVLKRQMENAMFDALVAECGARGITEIFGYYYPTAKNKMVKDFYAGLGFEKVSEDGDNNTTWRYEVAKHRKQCSVIQVNGDKR